MFNFNQIKQWVVLGIIAFLALVGVLFVSTRKSGEWVCKEGIWVAVGKPQEPRPGLYCK